MVEMDVNLSESYDRTLKRIIDDNTSGSVSIMGATSSLLNDMDRAGIDADVKRSVLLEIVSAHCSMAGLVNLADTILWTIEEDKPIEKVLEIEKEKRAFSMSKLVSNVVDKVLSASRIITISNSSTIIEILKAAHQRGAHKEIVLSEARPAMEGVLAAKELSSSGLGVTMVADGALSQEVKYSDLVLVGADSVTEKGVVNKIGTLGLISAAHELGIPSISAFTADKMISSRFCPFKRKLHPENELMEPDAEIKVMNYYFDQTPLDLFSFLITENGTMDTPNLVNYLEDRELHPEIVSTLLK
jgi:translation initiation factor 2B subunit (eIF-2B alpha/beta/delta family)